MRVTIGFLHKREEIRLQLPAGSRVKNRGQLLVEGGGELRCRLISSVPANGQWVVKVLETPRQELAQTLNQVLRSQGLEAVILPFAPAFADPDVGVRATQLVAIPEEQRQYWAGLGAMADIQHLQRQVRFADLWHLGQEQLYFQVRAAASAVVALRFASRKQQLPLEDLEIVLPPNSAAQVADVEVGIGFHWQYRSELRYPDTLLFFVDHEGKLGLANKLDLELYLKSVNSSEMTSDSPPALLEAQSIAARSTLLATRGRHHCGEAFDICADDHCQCYRGVDTIKPASETAIERTRGQVLCVDVPDRDTQICDARYSKSCGGIIEAYENVWENTPVAYLRAGLDTPDGGAAPMRNETQWRQWILKDEPDVWCNTDHWSLPNGLDYCNGYYRWQVRMTREEAATRIRHACKLSFEKLLDLQPVSRGTSGRLIQLAVVTDAGEFIIGRELVIRRALSDSHLYSALIFFTWDADTLVVTGKGWGHGVGMCQLGAARMAAEGRTAAEILNHYYPGSRLHKLKQTN